VRLLRVSTAYEAYLDQIFAENSELSSLNLAQLNYRSAKLKLDYDGFGWADFWEHALKPLGYEVQELVANAAPLQDLWAQEAGIQIDHLRGAERAIRIVEEQIRAFRPEIIFFSDFNLFPLSWLKELRKKFPNIKLMLAWCGSPYSDYSLLAPFDMVLSNVPELVSVFKNSGLRAEHLNHAFDPRILDRIDLKSPPQIELSFLGQISRQSGYHLKREQILKALLKEVPIEIFTPIPPTGTRDLFKQGLRLGAYFGFRALQKAGVPKSWLESIPKAGKFARLKSPPPALLDRSLRSCIKPGIFGLKMFQTLRNSAATLNTHIDASSHSASNMRLYEATGVGTCLITDWKENLHQLFDPELEIVSYRNIDECLEKVRWLSQNPIERKKIAEAGQKRCLKDHTMSHRALILDQIIQTELRKPHHHASSLHQS